VDFFWELNFQKAGISFKFVKQSGKDYFVPLDKNLKEIKLHCRLVRALQLTANGK